MRLAVLTALLGIVVLATGAVACGDSSNGGSGGSGNGGTGGNGSVDCAATDFDCATACTNLDTICNDSTCSGTQGCDEPDCVTSCNDLKANLDQIPAASRKLVTGLWNCLEANNACLSFGTCTNSCR